MSRQRPRYSDLIRQLQDIAERIQSEELDVDELSSLVRNAMEMLHICKKKIESAEVEIEKIIEKFEGEKNSGAVKKERMN